MEPISFTLYNSISQWFLFLGIALIIFGIIEKRENYILAGQIVFFTLGGLGLWVLFTRSMPLPDVNSLSMSNDFKVISFFKGLVVLMFVTALSLVQKLFRLPFQRAGIYFLIFIAVLLFFMLFNIMKTPHITPSV
jgi:hypothetical protein